MKTFFFFFLLVAQVNCASIVASRTDTLRVSASPPNAIVTLNGSAQGNPPLALQLPRRSYSSVAVTAPGYSPASCDTTMSASGGYIAADVILCVVFFPIGCISFIDAGGAWDSLESDTCTVNLSPVEAGAQGGPPGAPPRS